MSYTICDRCKGMLEKERVTKGAKGHVCLKCRKIAIRKWHKNRRELLAKTKEPPLAK